MDTAFSKTLLTISVIVPVYNVEVYVGKCIQSIINQTYNHLEIIIVDDGSTDKSGQICDEFAKKDNRIKVIHKENGGLSDARNVGIEAATGKYLAFIDSDDFVFETYLEYLLSLITSFDADVAVCQLVKVDEADHVLGVLSDTDHRKHINGTNECMQAFLSGTEIDTVAWRKLYKSSLFTDIRYPKGKYHEDVWTTYKYIAKCKTIAIGSMRLYAYRMRQGSIVNSAFTPKHLDGIKGSIDRFEYISEKYPDLKSLAAINIIYSANQCIMRLGRSGGDKAEYLAYIQQVYKKYLRYYLKGNSSFIAKQFSIIARYWPKSLIRIVHLFTKK